jgi:hypothetical protein
MKPEKKARKKRLAMSPLFRCLSIVAIGSLGLLISCSPGERSPTQKAKGPGERSPTQKAKVSSASIKEDTEWDESETQEPNDAEKQFRAMATKITKSKSFKCVFSGKNSDLANPLSINGTLIFSEGNRFLIEINIDSPDKFLAESKKRAISTGKEYRASVADESIHGSTPETICSESLTLFSRTGILVGFNGMFSDLFFDHEEIKADDLFAVKRFKMDSLVERIDNHDVQRIEYAIKSKWLAGRPIFLINLWLDTSTQLPVKRTVLSTGKDRKTFTETYIIELDAKFDRKIFELPKE